MTLLYSIRFLRQGDNLSQTIIAASIGVFASTKRWAVAAVHCVRCELLWRVVLLSVLSFLVSLAAGLDDLLPALDLTKA